MQAFLLKWQCTKTRNIRAAWKNHKSPKAIHLGTWIGLIRTILFLSWVVFWCSCVPDFGRKVERDCNSVIYSAVAPCKDSSSNMNKTSMFFCFQSSHPGLVSSNLPLFWHFSLLSTTHLIVNMTVRLLQKWKNSLMNIETIEIGWWAKMNQFYKNRRCPIWAH